VNAVVETPASRQVLLDSSAPPAAAPAFAAVDVKGFGGTRVHMSRQRRANGTCWWWIGVYVRRVCVATGVSAIGRDGGQPRFLEDDAQYDVALDATYVHLPEASWRQLKAWAEGLAAGGN